MEAPERETTHIRLGDVTDILPFLKVDQLMYDRLKERIPENLRGAFQVRTGTNGHHKITLEGLRIAPDPILVTLEKLHTLLAEKEDQSFTPLAYHKHRFLKDFAKEDLQRILSNGASFAERNTTLQESRSHNFNVLLKNQHAILCSEATNLHEISTDLDEAVQLSALQHGDRALIEKLRSFIPANQHGYFICDFVRDAQNQLQLAGLAVDPWVSMQLLGKGLGENMTHAHTPRILKREDLLLLANYLPAASATPSVG